MIVPLLQISRCWTQGKPDKLKYLNKAKMWYLTDKCSPLESLIVDSKLVDFETEGEWRRSRKRRYVDSQSILLIGHS